MLLLGLFGIDAFGLGDDEHCSWWASQLAWPDFVRLVHHVDAVLCPYYLFLRLWTSLFGDSELALRLPSTLAMAVAAGLTAELGKRIDQPLTGLFAGLVFSTIPSISSFAQETRPYALAVAAAVGSTLVVLRTLERPDSKLRWTLYGASVFLLGLTHLVSLSVLAAHASLLLRIRRSFPWLVSKRSSWYWLITVTIALCAISPMVYLSMRQSGQLRLINVTFDQFLKLRYSLTLNTQVGWLLLVASSLCLLRRRPYGFMLVLWALLPPLLFCLTYDIVHIFRPRYFLFTLPAWSLLAALGCSSLTKSPRVNSVVPIALLASLIFVSYSSHSSMRRHATARNNLAPYRFAGLVLEQYASQDDAIIYGSTSPRRYHNRLGIAYAMRNSEPLRDIFLKTKAETLGDFQAKDCQANDACLPDDVERLWFLTDSKPQDPFRVLAPNVASRLEAQFIKAKKWPLGHKVLYLFKKREPSQDGPFATEAENSSVETPDGEDVDASGDEGELGTENRDSTAP